MSRHKNKIVIEPDDAINVPHPKAKLLYKLEPRKGPQITSFCWLYFHHIVGVVDDDDDNSKAKKALSNWKAPNEYAVCNCCGATLLAKSNVGWTNASMQPHLLSAHQVSKSSELKRKAKEAGAKPSTTPIKRKQTSLHESFTQSSHKKIKTHSQVRAEQIEAAAVWIAGTNQPLNAVEHPLFRDMTSSISTSVKPITMMNVKERIIDLD
jgi:hypothetical protein